MDDIKDRIKHIIEDVVKYDEIKISDIPSIDLYMDQVTTFMEKNLSNSKRKPEDKIITKTMINNYAKDGLLPAPLKKKYNKEHMILIILIYHMKSQLSISDIKVLLSAFINGQSSDTMELYKNFLEVLKKASEDVLNETLREAEYINDNMDIVLFALKMTMRANMEKRIAEKIIDSIKFF